jgi:hypothetical protein
LEVKEEKKGKMRRISAQTCALLYAAWPFFCSVALAAME